MGKVKSGSNFRAIDAASDRETPLNIILHIGRNVLLVDPDKKYIGWAEGESCVYVPVQVHRVQIV